MTRLAKAQKPRSTHRIDPVHPACFFRSDLYLRIAPRSEVMVASYVRSVVVQGVLNHPCPVASETRGMGHENFFQAAESFSQSSDGRGRRENRRGARAIACGWRQIRDANPLYPAPRQDQPLYPAFYAG